MMVLMFHTLMDRKKMLFHAHSLRPGFGTSPCTFTMLTQRQNKSQKTTRTNVKPQCKCNRTQIFLFIFILCSTDLIVTRQYNHLKILIGILDIQVMQVNVEYMWCFEYKTLVKYICYNTGC